MSKYYDGTKLLSLKDLNGNEPEIFICTGNRSAGKTVYFSRLLMNRFIKNNEKFCLLYRYSYELDDVADKFFKDINKLFFPCHTMTAKKRARGAFCELFYGIQPVDEDDEFTGDPCGYAIALNNSDQIKKYSHFFSDVKYILFDEFQSEANHYCSDEITKFISIHKSIARGNGEQARHVPVFMLSNTVSIINPYYTELGISSRLNSDTKFLRGDGFVLESTYNASASEAQRNSGFDKAFVNNKYIAYSTQNVYLNDNMAFIDKPTGKNVYLCTIKYMGKEYAVREYPHLGIIYCDTNVDTSFKTRITTTTDDHQINYVMLKHSSFFISNLRFLFERGCFRFKDLNCKEAVLTTLSY